MNNVGIYLLRCRVTNKVSQDELANHLGLSSGQSISNVERGTTSPPLKYIDKWCEVAGANKKKVLKFMTADFNERVSEALGL